MKTRIFVIVIGTLIGILVVACGAPPLGAPAALPTRAAAGANPPATTVNGTAVANEIAMSAGMQDAVSRIGTETLKPEAKLDQPNVALDPSQVPAPIHRTENTTVEVNLSVKEVTAEIAPGASYTFWTFDGHVPGPMIRVMEGDTVKLTINNPATNTMGHNIDLHAVNGPGGGAGVTMVMPGESKTFTFKALNAGAYVYHCAYPPPFHHIAQGMYGAIIVEPKGGLPPVDREFYVMQGEWYTTGKFGDQGNQEFSETKAMAEQPEYFTMNGNAEALSKLHPLKAHVGENIRIFFGVGGPNVGSNFHVIGEIFDKVYSGSPDTFIKNEETTYVPPGSVTTVELKLNEPGKYTLVDHALYRVAKGAAGVLMVDGTWDDSLYSPNGENSTH